MSGGACESASKRQRKEPERFPAGEEFTPDHCSNYSQLVRLGKTTPYDITCVPNCATDLRSSVVIPITERAHLMPCIHEMVQVCVEVCMRGA